MHLQNGFCSIVDQRFSMKNMNWSWEFEEGEGELEDYFDF